MPAAIPLELELKVVCSWLPIPCIAVIAATAIKAAIRPYSIAVAPALLLMILRINCMALVFLADLTALWADAVKTG